MCYNEYEEDDEGTKAWTDKTVFDGNWYAVPLPNDNDDNDDSNE